MWGSDRLSAWGAVWLGGKATALPPARLTALDEQCGVVGYRAEHGGFRNVEKRMFATKNG